METKKEELKDHKKEDFTKHEGHECKKEDLNKPKKKCCNGKDFLRGLLFGILVASILASLLIYTVLIPLQKKEQPFDSEKVTSRVETFINENLLNGGNQIIIKAKAVEEHGLYKVVFDAGDGRDVDSYITKDGKFLFFQGIDIDKIEGNKSNGTTETPPAEAKEIPKNEKPKVEVFVMSYCPYGAQIEKGILPVIKALGDKIDFEIKFVDYAMHGKKELDEQVKQHCIKTNEPTKFVPYLECFLEAGDSESCLTKTNINVPKLNTCISATDKEYKITENFNDKSTYKGSYAPFNIYKEDNIKYGVAGSPTLVINEVTTSSSRDSKSLLATVCSAFETAPAECSTELSSAKPSPGFGSATTTTTGGSEASCN